MKGSNFYLIIFLFIFPIITNSATVMNNNNNGAGSLREAIDNAVDNEIIDFDASLNGMTIVLLSRITIDDSITITGPGSGLLTIQSDGTDQIFRIEDDDDPADADLDVEISGLTLTGGRTNAFGGAIFCAENLTLNDVIIVDNIALIGAGILNSPGNLTINNSELSNNHIIIENIGGGVMAQTGSGGAINHSFGELIIDSTLVSSNSANQGGGIFTSQATTTITNSIIEKNSTLGGSSANSGGGINASRGILNIIDTTVKENISRTSGGVSMFGNTGNPGQLNISSSTFYHNTAVNGSGGAITNILSVMNLDNSTISSNFAFNPDDNLGSGRGAAIRNSFANAFDLANRATSNISNTTIINNNSDNEGAAIFNGIIDIVNLKNTLLINNTANKETDRVVCSSSGNQAELNDLGGNISDVPVINMGPGSNPNDACTVFFDSAFNPLTMIDSDLADNGGPTMTHALFDPDPMNTPNPAIDGVVDCTTVSGENLDTDQRGVNRPQGPACDIGAFELQVDTDGDGTIDDDEECPNDSDKLEPGICGCGTADTDSDTDGTPDCNDNCINDPDKVDPGQCGCNVADTDTDTDGTADCNDNCVDDPDKTEPGQCGCGVADTDSDTDGTPDCNDNCADDPDKTEPGECGCGVADTDTDTDGTPDCNDNCADDPDKTEPGECGCGVPEGCNDPVGDDDDDDNDNNDDNEINDPPTIEIDVTVIEIINNNNNNPLGPVTVNFDFPEGIMPLGITPNPFDSGVCSILNGNSARIADADIDATCEINDIDESIELFLNLCNDGSSQLVEEAIIEITSPDLNEDENDLIEIIVNQLQLCQVIDDNGDAQDTDDEGCNLAPAGSKPGSSTLLFLLIPAIIYFRRLSIKYL